MRHTHIPVHKTEFHPPLSGTTLKDKFPDINIDIPGLVPESGPTNFLFFMWSLVFGMFWITYITFFNSRIVGKILTRICRRFVKEGHIRVSGYFRHT